MWQSLVAIVFGVFSAFGGLLGGVINPVHDSDSAKTLEVEYADYEQQKNEASGTRSMTGTDGAEAAPQAQEAQTEEERPLIDVARHSTTTQTASETGEHNRQGKEAHVSVLTD